MISFFSVLLLKFFRIQTVSSSTLFMSMRSCMMMKWWMSYVMKGNFLEAIVCSVALLKLGL
jgi:hypothetical protein